MEEHILYTEDTDLKTEQERFERYISDLTYSMISGNAVYSKPFPFMREPIYIPVEGIIIAFGKRYIIPQSE